MNPTRKIPPKGRIALYLVYGIAGPVLTYTQAKGWTGSDELNLWVGLGAVFGLTAASNVRPARNPDNLEG